jgi:hypothetical protein
VSEKSDRVRDAALEKTEPDVDRMIHRATAMYPPAEITPAEYEAFVVEVFRAAESPLVKYKVELHEVIRAADGSYDFDGTVRFRAAGMDFLVLIEAKKHTHPIKREIVQTLQQKKESVGAQKAVLVSTAPFQRGAVNFAVAHGIALMTLTEGRFKIEVRSRERPPAPSREEALDWYGLPTFVAEAFAAGEQPRSIRVWELSPSRPDWLRDWLLAT